MSLSPTPWAPKRAGETDYRGIDWKNDLDAGETISSFDFAIGEDSALTLGSKIKDIAKPVTIITLTGGVAGTEEAVVCSITTSLTRTLEVEKILPIT